MSKEAYGTIAFVQEITSPGVTVTHAAHPLPDGQAFHNPGTGFRWFVDRVNVIIDNLGSGTKLTVRENGAVGTNKIFYETESATGDVDLVFQDGLKANENGTSVVVDIAGPGPVDVTVQVEAHLEAHPA